MDRKPNYDLRLVIYLMIMIMMVVIAYMPRTTDATVTDATITTAIVSTETTTTTEAETTSKLPASYQQVKAKSTTRVVTDEETTLSDALNTNGYKKMTVVATAYCPCKDCSGGYGWGTATGTVATAGRTIAVDPSVIPYGSKVIINGHTYVAEDCGGGIKGNRIDIFFDRHSEVQAFGRQTLDIYSVR